MQRHEELIRWMIDNDAQFSSSLEIRQSGSIGSGVFALRDLEPETVIYTIAKSHVLSPATCGIADILREHNISGIHGLAVAYLFEKCQGNSSPWLEYLDTISAPDIVPLPQVWPKEDKALLKGSDLERMGGIDETDLLESWSNVIEPFLSRFKEFFSDEQIDYSAYLKALYVVQSRAFEVDNFRGPSLVPGACLFNHSDNETARFESQIDVCDACGDTYCEHMMHDESESEDEEEDYSSEDPAPPLIADWEVKGNKILNDNKDGADESDVADDEDDEEEDLCHITLVSPAAAGSEIFNSYGEYSNSQLLSRYGFAIWDNRHESVDLGVEISQFAKANDLRPRLKWWSKYFYLCLFGLDPRQYKDYADQVEDLDELPPPPESISWRSLLEIDSSGEPGEGLALVCALLQMSPKKYLMLQTRVKKNGSAKLLTGENGDKVLKWCVNKRLDAFPDAKLRSMDYARLAEDATSRNAKLAFIVMGTQKLVLERCYSRM